MVQQIVTVMQNNTICIPNKIRKLMDIKPKDLVLVILDKGQVTIKKAPSSFHDLAGTGQKTFKSLGGGEAYLKKERGSWKKT